MRKHPNPYPNPTHNPWMTALGFVWVLTGLVGILLLATGSDTYYDEYTGQQVAGAMLIGISSTVLAAWLLAGALTWRPSAVPQGVRPSGAPLSAPTSKSK